MKNQVHVLNSGSIEKIEIFRDRIEFFPSQLCEVRGQIEQIKSLVVN